MMWNVSILMILSRFSGGECQSVQVVCGLFIEDEGLQVLFGSSCCEVSPDAQADHHHIGWQQASCIHRRLALVQQSLKQYVPLHISKQWLYKSHIQQLFTPRIMCLILLGFHSWGYALDHLFRAFHSQGYMPDDLGLFTPRVICLIYLDLSLLGLHA